MGKCAECTSRAVTGVLNVVTFGRFIDFGMKLLLGSSMAVLAGIASITTHRITPFVSRFDVGARSGPKKVKTKVHEIIVRTTTTRTICKLGTMTKIVERCFLQGFFRNKRRQLERSLHFLLQALELFSVQCSWLVVFWQKIARRS